MNSKHSVPRLLLNLVTIFTGLVYSIPSASAYLDVLPGGGFFPGMNGRTLSADGEVVIGYYASSKENYFFRWTPSGATTRLPAGPGGYPWTSPLALTANGNTIVGYGERTATISLTWTAGIGTQSVTDGKSSMYIGVAPDASYSVRIDLGSNRQTAYRDYANLSSSKWASVTGVSDQFWGTSGDASRLFGTAHDALYNKNLPCYWDSAGEITFCSALESQLNANPIFANKNGQYITGTVDLDQYIEDYGNATTTFVWNTATNQVAYYTPLSFILNYPVFISPDGKILGIGGYVNPTEYKTYILDQSNPTQVSLGYQEVSDWLVSHQYISHADLAGKTHFSVTGMSDDELAVVGLFIKNGHTYSFYAHRLVAMKTPPLTTKLVP